jgi:hypothetical protein
LRHFEVVVFDSPLRVFTVIGLAVIAVLKRAHLGFAEWPLKQLCRSLD